MAYSLPNYFLIRPRPRWFGFRLDPEQKRWFALDGKELRGSVESGQKRGEVCVSALAHQTQTVTQPTYYQGTKESERPTVRQLLNTTGLYNQKLTMDALHLNPLTVNAIEAAEGVYLIGLKPNQAHLYRYCVCNSMVNQAIYERTDAPQRGHGRLDQRSYSCFQIVPTALAPVGKNRA